MYNPRRARTLKKSVQSSFETRISLNQWVE